MDTFFRLRTYFKMAFMSLYLNRLRSLLSILGIIFGVMAVTVIISVGEGTKREALRQIEKLGIRNVYVRAVEVAEEKKRSASKNYNFGLVLSDMTRLKHGCGALANAAALKVLNVSVLGTLKEINPQVVSVTASYGAVLDLKIHKGRFLVSKDSALSKEVCVVGHDIAMTLGKDGRLGAVLQIEDYQYEIVGILDSYQEKENSDGAISVRNYNEMVFIPMGNDRWVERKTRANDRLGSEYLTEFILRVDRPEHVLDSSLVIKRIMANIHPDLQDYQIITPLELLNQTQKTKKMFSLFLVTIASISLLVGGIGIMNIMLASVLERRMEIGTRRAVGAQKGHILIQFLTESFILTFLGGLLGVSMGVSFVFLLSYVIPWKSAVTAEAIVLPLIISSLTGILSGVYPAYSAANVDPITALRS